VIVNIDTELFTVNKNKKNDDSKERMKQAAENEEKAFRRGREAAEAEREMRLEQENKENAHIIARNRAVELERQRSLKIAKLPRVTDDVEKLFDPNKPTKLVSHYDSSVFTTTRYHMPEHIVDRASFNEDVNYI
jgi:hypothetical protein